MIELRSEHLTVTLAPEQGAEIRFLGRPGGANMLAHYDWQAPLRASESYSYGSTLSDWVSEFRGGWQELFPNAGPECIVNGVELPFHGEVSLAPWEVTEASGDSVRLRTPARLPLLLERQMRLAPDRAALYIEEAVVNESGLSIPLIWVQHICLSPSPGSRLDLPNNTVHVDDGDMSHLGDLLPGARADWPRIGSRTGVADLSIVPEVATDRLCYLTNLAGGWAAVRDHGSGFALAWDRAVYPHAWLWQEIEVATMPSYGRSRIVAIEPASTWPADGLARAQEEGRAHVLAPSARLRSWITAALFEADEDEVFAVARDGTVTTRARGTDNEH